ncbi:MAG: hypothetical protein ACOY4H_06830 [Thermodesulfobacteriota bacterium]
MMQADLSDTLLPGGWIDHQGRVQRQARLRPVTGYAERLIAASAHLSTPARTTRLLAAAVAAIGDHDRVSEDDVRSLLVADRQQLVRTLRRVTFGPEVRAVLGCSWPDCGEMMDIDFSLDLLALTEAPQTGLFHTVRLAEATGGLVVTFRLPNGGDQEALSDLVEEDEEQAADLLLTRCLQSIADATGTALPPPLQFDPPTRAEIEAAMASRAPRFDLTLAARCPECDRPVTAAFDLERFFCDELHAQQDLLLHEVHYLALHYHWSEREILSMPRENRRRYLDILASHLETAYDAR